MMNSKVTYVDALSFVLGNCEMPAEISEKLEVLKGQIVRRNSAERKPTAKQRANAEANAQIADLVRDILSHYNGLTVAEIIEKGELDVSTQKLSAVLKGMGAEIVRTVDKRKAYYSLAE